MKTSGFRRVNGSYLLRDCHIAVLTSQKNSECCHRVRLPTRRDDRTIAEWGTRGDGLSISTTQGQLPALLCCNVLLMTMLEEEYSSRTGKWMEWVRVWQVEDGILASGACGPQI